MREKLYDVLQNWSMHLSERENNYDLIAFFYHSYLVLMIIMDFITTD